MDYDYYYHSSSCQSLVIIVEEEAGHLNDHAPQIFFLKPNT